MSLIQMSLHGAVFIAAVVIIRALTFKRVPHRTFVILWGVVFLTLLVPFSVPSNFSLYTFAGNIISAHRNVQTNVGGDGYTVNGSENAFGYGMENDGKVTYISDTMATGASWFSGISVWSGLWLAGMMIIAVYFAVAYIRSMREFRMSLPVQNEYLAGWSKSHRLRRVLSVRQSDRISSPLTYGILRPVILMPKETDWTDGSRLRFVLEHEYVHVRHFDAAAKLIAAAVLCVHWFNPMVWVMYILFNRDIELACDEGVINAFGQASRADYARTLIDMEAKRSGLMPFCSSFNKNSIEERITAIMKNKKMTIFSAILGFAIVAGATTIFATSAKAEDKAADEFADGQTEAGSSGSDVEWWTYDEYKAWLEEEIVQLNSVLGEKGWTNETGEFVWTQEKIDETIQMYEETLEEIKNGAHISIAMIENSEADGTVAGIQMENYDADAEEVGANSLWLCVMQDGEPKMFGPYQTNEELLAEVKPYFDEQVSLGNMTEEEAQEILDKYEERGGN